jgi:hypothetical protein
MGEKSEDELREAYRDPGRQGAPEPGKPEPELSYFPEGKSSRSLVSVYYGSILPIIAGSLVAALLGSAWGLLLGAGIVGAWFYWQRQRAKLVPRATLRVVRGRLHLSGPAFGEPLAMGLNDLLDVYLDTKTIRRVQEGPSVIPAVALLNQTVGGEQDTARIALECERETYFLTEERLSHLDSNEWFGKIRRFLRKHGWVPEDERDGR